MGVRVFWGWCWCLEIYDSGVWESRGAGSQGVELRRQGAGSQGFKGGARLRVVRESGLAGSQPVKASSS